MGETALRTCGLRPKFRSSTCDQDDDWNSGFSGDDRADDNGPQYEGEDGSEQEELAEERHDRQPPPTTDRGRSRVPDVRACTWSAAPSIGGRRMVVRRAPKQRSQGPFLKTTTECKRTATVQERRVDDAGGCPRSCTSSMIGMVSDMRAEATRLKIWDPGGRKRRFLDAFVRSMTKD